MGTNMKKMVETMLPGGISRGNILYAQGSGPFPSCLYGFRDLLCPYPGPGSWSTGGYMHRKESAEENGH